MRRHHSRFKAKSKNSKIWMAPSNIYTPGTSPWASGTFPLKPYNVTNDTLFSITAAQTAQQGTGTVPTTPEYAQRFTCLNIRGQITFAHAQDSGLTASIGRIYYSMGMMYGAVDSNGAVEVVSPEVASDGDKSWMWLHTGIVGSPRTADANHADPSFEVVDVNIKTRRVLAGDEAVVLWFICQSEVVPTNTNLRIGLLTPQLRVLYSKGL